MKTRNFGLVGIVAFVITLCIVIVSYTSLKTTNTTPLTIEEPLETEEVGEIDDVTETNSSLLTQSTPTVLDHTNWVTITSDQFGVSYSSPENFIWNEHPIQRTTRDKLTFGDHGIASITLPNAERSGAAVLSVSPIENPDGREGYWGDIINIIENDVNCSVFLNDSLHNQIVNDCTSFLNSNGHEVIHLQVKFNGFYPEPALINLYVIAHPDPEIRTVLLSDERLLPRDSGRNELVSYLSEQGFDTVQSTRDMVRTIADTLDFVE